MSRRRPGLWAEVALALALITLAALVLDAGVFWLLARRGEVERRTDQALVVARSIAASLEQSEPARWRAVLRGWRRSEMDIATLWAVDQRGRTVAALVGSPPATPDPGLRSALFAREEHAERGPGRDSISVTEPVLHGGAIAGALRIVLPLSPAGTPGGALGFFLAYTAFCGAMIAIFGFGLFRQRLLKPVDRLRQATARIAAGDFGHEVRLEAARELVELAEALNAMSRHLAGYRERTARNLRGLEAANAELRRVQEELIRSEKLASVGRLAAGVAHEIGNPLAAVLGYAELLLQDAGTAGGQRELLLRARRELERIQRIIGELLDYARPGEGRRVLVQPRVLLEAAVDTVRHHPLLREVELSIRVPDGTPPLEVEPDKVHQVLVNLLLNALDALGGSGSIALSAEPQGDEVVLCCSDDGPGFTTEALQRAFEPFFTTKGPGAGTGLGLAAAQRIVELQGGWIRAENGEAGGAAVRVGLPAARPGAEP